MDIAEVRKVVGRIRASLFKNSNSHSIGMLKSHFRGSGLQFKEHQVYEPGDDVRFIDWKLLAKMNQPYIKTFEEERNVEIAVVIDASETMKMGYNDVSKLQAAIELTCLLYLLAEQTKDSIHAIIISDKVQSVQKANGERGIASLVKTLEMMGLLDSTGRICVSTDSNDQGVSSEKKSREVLKHLKKNREVVLLSDFDDFILDEDLRRVLYKKNTHAFKIKSPIEDAQNMPYALWLKRSEGKNYFKTKFIRNEKDEPVFAKHIKTLDVSDRYLEEFVREMS